MAFVQLWPNLGDIGFWSIGNWWECECLEWLLDCSRNYNFQYEYQNPSWVMIGKIAQTWDLGCLVKLLIKLWLFLLI
jgi:hypothetical protein